MPLHDVDDDPSSGGDGGEAKRLHLDHDNDDPRPASRPWLPSRASLVSREDDDDGAALAPAHASAGGSRPTELNRLHPEHFGLDPLFWAHLKLFNSGIQGMTKIENCTQNCLAGVRAVYGAHVVGVLVAVVAKPTLSRFTVDDGTALLECLLWDCSQGDLRAFECMLGCIVRAYGRLEFPSQARFEQCRRLVLARAPELVRDPNEEVLHWLEAIDLWPVYCTPMVLPADDEHVSALPPAPSLDVEIHNLIKQVPPMPLIAAVGHLDCVSTVQGDEFRAYRETMFHLPELCRQPRIFAWHVGTSDRLTAVRQAVGVLVNKGLVAVIDVTNDVFGVITTEGYTIPGIVSAMRNILRHRPHDAAVSKAAIVAAARVDSRLRNVAQSRFEHALRRMVQDSLLAVAGKDEYRFVCL